MLDEIMQALSAPRRAAWGAMGLPEEGSAALQQLFGMDPDDPLTKVLGGGAEFLGDPLTWATLGGGAAGLLGGRALAGAKAAAAGRTAKIAGLGAEMGEMEQLAGRFAGAAQQQAKAPTYFRPPGDVFDQGTRLPPLNYTSPSDLFSLPTRSNAGDEAIGALRQRLRPGFNQVTADAQAAGVPKADYLADLIGTRDAGIERGLRSDVAQSMLEPSVPYSSLLRDASTKSQGTLADLLQQLQGLQNPQSMGLLEEGFARPGMSALEKAMLGGTAAGSIGGGIYAGTRR